MPQVDAAVLARQLGGKVSTPPPSTSGVDPVALAAQLGGKSTGLEDRIRSIAQEHGVDPDLALAVARRESSLNPSAVGDSGKAIGLFQMHSGAAEDTGVTNRHDPIQNITGGVRYLKQLHDRYGGDRNKALMAYNGGMKWVDEGKVSPAAQAYAAEVIASLSQQARQSAAGRGRGSGPGPGPSTRPPSTPPPQPTDPAVARPESLAARFKRTGQIPTAAETLGVDPEIPSTIRSTIASIVPQDKALPMAGALVGGAKGAAMGAPAGPPGMVLGGIAGAGLGAGAGEVLTMGIEKLSEYFGFTPSSRPMTVRDAAARVSEETNTAMLGQVMGEAGLRILTPVAKKVLAPMASKLSTYAREAMQTFPGRVLPTEASEGRLFNISENIAEGSFFGGGRISDVKTARQSMAESKVLEVLEQLGSPTGPRAAGTTAQAARNVAVQQFRAQENAAWDAFRTEAADLPVQTPKLDEFIAELQGREAGAILPNAGAEAARRIARLAGDDATGMQQLLDQGYGNLPPDALALIKSQLPEAQGMTAVQFQKTVSDLGRLTRSLEESAKSDPSKFNSQLGLARKLLNLARQDLDTSLAANPEAKAAFEAASNVSKLGNERLFNDAVMKVASQAPEKVVGVLLKPNNSTAINAVREAVGPAGFEPVQRVAMQRLTMPDPRTGKINWGRQAQRLQAMGDDTLDALFPNGHAQEVQRIARLMLEIQQRPGGNLGTVGIYLTQWGPLAAAGTSVLTGTLPPLGGVAVLSAPYVWARILTNPTATKWLTTGLQAPAGSAQAIRAGAMLTAFLKQEMPQPVASHEAQP